MLEWYSWTEDKVQVRSSQAHLLLFYPEGLNLQAHRCQARRRGRYESPCISIHFGTAQVGNKLLNRAGT